MPIYIDQQTATQIFLGAWAVLAVVGAFIFMTGSPASKRRAQPILVGAAVLIMPLYMYYTSASLPLFIFSVPVLAFIWFANAVATKYCPNCGARNYNPFLLPIPKYCMRCGTLLEGKSPPAA